MNRVTKSTWRTFCNNPSESGFKALYQRTSGLVYTVCMRILCNEEDARDAFQGTYCRLVELARDAERAGKINDVGGLVCRLAVREADALRKRRSRRERKKVVMGKQLPLHNDAPALGESIDKTQTRERVSALVSTLPDKYRVPVMLHYFDGLTHQEIAGALNCSRATISNRIARALKRLQPAMRRAGLGEATAVFAMIFAGSQLLSPPSTFAAETVFQHALTHAAAAQAGGAAATTAASGAGATGIGGVIAAKLLALGGVVTSKAAILSLAAVVGVSALVFLAQPLLFNDDNGNREDPAGLQVASSNGDEKNAVSKKTDEDIAKKGGVPQPVKQLSTGGTTIFGKVYFKESGLPAAGAKILSFPPGGPTCVAGQDGAYELAGVKGGFCMFGAMHGPFLSHLSLEELKPVKIDEGGANGPFDLHLRRGLVLRGKVVDEESGKPVKNAEVKTQLFAPITVHADAEGRYAIEGLPAMMFQVKVKARGYAFTTAMFQLTKEGANTLDISLEPEGVAEVFVVDAAGRPIKNAGIMVSHKPSLYFSPEQNRTSAKGRCIVRGVSRKKPLGIRVSKPGYEMASKAVLQFPENRRHARVTVVLNAKQEENAQWAFAGKVTDASGKPLEGVRISWGYNEYPNQGPHFAETDENGAYRLDVRKHNVLQMQLSASKAAYAPEWERNVPPGTFEKPNQVDFTLDRGRWVELTVRNEQGMPLPHVFLHPYVEDHDDPHDENEIPGLKGSANAYKTDHSGKCRIDSLPSGPVGFRFWRFGYTDLGCVYDVLDRQIDVVMKEAGVIRGLVVDKESGKPLPEFNVKVKGGRISVSRYRVGQSVADAKGRFELKELHQDGKYRVTIEAPGYPAFSLEGIVAAAPGGKQEERFELVRSEMLAGCVSCAETGTPLAGVTVFSAVSRGIDTWEGLADENSGRYRNILRTATGKDGVFALNEGKDKGVLFVCAPGFARRMVKPQDRSRFIVRDSTRLAIDLEPGATLSGNVFEAGKPYTAGSVRLRSAGNESMEPAAIDENGRFKIGSLAPGLYNISVYKQKGRIGFSWLSTSCRLKRGEHKTISIGDDMGPCSLKGRVLDESGRPVEEARVVLRPGFEWYQSLIDYTDGKGFYEVKGLQPGEYSVTASKNYYPRNRPRRELKANATLSVKGNTTHDFAFAKQCQVKARIAFEGGALKDAAGVTVTRASLDYVHYPDSYTVNAPGQIKYSGSVRVTGADIAFDGLYKGLYRLQIHCRTAAGSYFSYHCPQRFELDNSREDHDLGAITIGRPGDLVFEGTIHDADKTPVKSVAVRLSPLFASACAGFTAHSDDRGRFRLEGLKRGIYRVRMNLRQDGAYRRIYDTIEINGNLSRTFVFDEANQLSGKLVLDNASETASALGMARLWLRHVAFPGRDPVSPDGLTLSESAELKPHGGFTMRGKFKGRYDIIVSFRREDDEAMVSVPAGSVMLNTISGHQDLGDIPVSLPAFQAVRTRFTIHGDRSPQYGGLYFFPKDSRTNAFVKPCDNFGEGVHELSDIPAGVYEVTAYARDFKCVPLSVPVTIEAGGAPPEVAFELHPHTGIKGTVNLARSYDPAPVTRISIKGNGLTRTLMPKKKTGRFSPYYQNVIACEDWLNNGSFNLIDLPEGDYEVTAELDGYRSAVETVRVEKGKVAQVRMSMVLSE